jgi:hypothetical protein
MPFFGTLLDLSLGLRPVREIEGGDFCDQNGKLFWACRCGAGGRRPHLKGEANALFRPPKNNKKKS